MPAVTPWPLGPPRAWQVEALDAVRAALAGGCRRPLVSAVMGAGKSRLIAEMALRSAASGRRVVVVTPTQHLVEQLAGTIREAAAGTIRDAAGEVPVGRWYQHAEDQIDRGGVLVTCAASLPTAGRADLLVVDEAHREDAERLDRLAGAGVPWAVGLTATPYRAGSTGQARALTGEWRCVYSYRISDALRDGVLVPYRAETWDGDGVDEDAIRAAVAHMPSKAEAEAAASVLRARAVVRRLVTLHARGPGIVSARSIADAESCAVELVEDGIEAQPIHSRLPRREREARLEWLSAAPVDGPPRALVHVQLLAEGVDLPLLRWLCLRRRVGSLVRLAQEVGRALRAAPGKTEAVVLDPYDLVATYGIDTPTALEEAQREEKEETPADDGWTLPDLDDEGAPLVLPRPVAVDHLSAWAARVICALRLAGIAPPPRVSEGAWRRRPSSDPQRRTLSRMRSRCLRGLPVSPARTGIEYLLAHPEDLRSGTASDLISALSALRDSGAAAAALARVPPRPETA